MIESKSKIASLEESNAYIQKILNSMKLFLDCLHFPIAIINVEGRYVYYNEESAEIDGCSREFALGNLLLNVYAQKKALCCNRYRLVDAIPRMNKITLMREENCSTTCIQPLPFSIKLGKRLAL